MKKPDVVFEKVDFKEKFGITFEFRMHKLFPKKIEQAPEVFQNLLGIVDWNLKSCLVKHSIGKLKTVSYDTTMKERQTFYFPNYEKVELNQLHISLFWYSKSIHF